jgi:hypothetical protein
MVGVAVVVKTIGLIVVAVDGLMSVMWLPSRSGARIQVRG